ncbi:MAG: hypothetical protein ACOZD0_12080 [Pseudomonadota bacterium]
MPARQAPDLIGQTQLNNHGGIRDVQAPVMRKVTYVFRATSSTNLRIPYAVAVDGRVLDEFAHQTRRVSGSSGRIELTARRGARVALYLNSDAHPSYRTQPVYSVTVGARDMVVTITEKTGRHADADTPTLAPAASGAAAPQVDRYTAPLTGDIWMRISHRYTADEVDALVPTGTAKEVIAAIKSIYEPLKTAKLDITIPAQADKEQKKLAVTFLDSDNPRQNITRYSLLEDGLTRVHPGGYAALFNAALENGIPSIRLTSCWRPMLGSIAHRAGLGLDVDYVGDVRMNRQELRQRKGDGDDADNVTDAEVERFRAFERAADDQRRAQRRLDSVAAEVRKAEAELRRATGNKAATLPEEHILVKAERGARSALNTASEKVAEARRAWKMEADAGEPNSVRGFRSSLLRCRCVGQLFDPWYMESNTQDRAEPEPNLQKTSNETLHSHHLHVTVHEPSIL